MLQFKDKGKIQLYVLEYLPEKSYSDANKGLIYEKDFSGMVFVKNWEDRVVGGGNYLNGKRISAFSSISKGGRTNATYCYSISRVYFTNGCVLGQEVTAYGHSEIVDGCAGGGGVNTQALPNPPGNCAGWVMTDYECFNECYDVPDPDPNPIVFPPSGGSGGFYSLPITNADIALNNLSSNPCAESVFNAISSQNGSMADFINTFASPNGNYTKFTYNIEISNSISGTGQTSSDGVGTITTKLNCSYLKEATKLAIARTMMHEALHAYMYAYLVKEGKNVFIQNFPDVIWQFGGQNINTHEQMVNSYLNTIAEALKQLDGNRQDEQFYKDIAWGGLTGTSSFLALSGTDKTRILDRLVDEQVGNAESKGDKCSNTGGNCN